MTKYAVHAFLGLTTEGQTEEATIEVDSLEHAFERIREIDGTDWKAITIVPAEDLPKLMGASEQMSAATPTDAMQYARDHGDLRLRGREMTDED